ncbi:MAG: D-alanine--poly(phosphoribitol) ligase subunit DltA [Lactobacillus sp.]|jgi:D-alanine--poly(phosphoribitol) ligase subunit 1|nr:D-alanine--poly(phosphoribitol) ligase subunit DltA [Lactobacillus sp.]MCI2032983.1 D-alanine--poly(phosphoribitol) ligase subunit DltA [Lactobacillus sp.]
MITNVITAIDAIATATPQRWAYDVLGDKHSYGELKQAADKIAAAIAQRQLPQAAPIMVYCDQSFLTIATFLGCVKAGHAYIPVDTHSPQERLVMIAEIAQPALAIAVVPLPVAVAVPTTTAADLLAATVPAAQALTPVSGDDTFYIIFTSGTTGQPKGVQISHDNLLSFVNWMVGFDWPAQPQTLSQAPYSFDLSVMSLYPALVLGGTLKVLPAATTANLKALFAALPTLALQVWVSTPSFMAICLLEPTFDAAHYPDLTRFFFCGEELPHALAQELLRRFPQAQIYNTYGPTETTVAVSAVAITPAILARYERLPIGVAKPDTQISLRAGGEREDNGQTVGELLIAGPSVSKGYLNRPDKTAAAFLPAGYATGDLGFVDDAGMLFYRGRTDFQIKLNGYRIELEEVNHYLNREPLIQQAVAVPKYGADHKVKQLLAYVVPADNAYPSELALTKALRQALQAKMMAYMVPQRFVYRESLPLTTNGKVAIKALIQEANS